MLLQTASLFRRYFACTPNETFARLLPLGVRSFMAAHLKPLFEVLQLPLRLQNVLVFGGYNHDAENFAVIDYFLNHIHQSRNALETNSTQGSERVGWTTRVVSLAPRPNDVMPRDHDFLPQTHLHSLQTFFDTEVRHGTDAQDNPLDASFGSWSEEKSTSHAEDAVVPEVETETVIETSTEAPYTSIQNTQLFLFGHMFSHFIRKRCQQTNSSGLTLNSRVVRLLDMIFTNAPEGSVFLFFDFAQPQTDTSLPYQHVMQTHYSKFMLVSAIKRHELNVAASFSMDVFVAVKPYKHQLAQSVYSTLSRLRSDVLQFQSQWVSDHPLHQESRSKRDRNGQMVEDLKMYLRDHIHYDLSSFRVLRQRVGCANEAFELDEVALRHNLQLLVTLRPLMQTKDRSRMMTLTEDSLKKYELVHWFFKYRSIL